MSYERALAVAVEAALEAGAILRARGADAERAIREMLLASFPWRYLGDRMEPGREDPSHMWLVVANDGSRAYEQGARGSAVSIGVLRDGVPVLGVVHAFSFPDDAGDLVSWAEGAALERRGGQVSSVADSRLDARAVVLVARGAWDAAPGLAETFAPARFRAIPSVAYRLALVAAGDAAGAVARGTIEARRLVGAHALLRGAGAVLVDGRGDPVSYGLFGDAHVRTCIGAPASIAQELVRRPRSRASIEATPFRRVRLKPGETVADPQVLSRAQGCLLGQFAGDALGSQVEFKSSASIRNAYTHGVREIVDGGTWNTLAGQPTDDSELALMLARSLVRAGRFDAGDALDAYVQWYRSRPFDVGGTIGAALGAASRLDSDEDRLARVAEVGNKNSQANGSLMRISPLGVFGAADPVAAAELAREDSALTHPHSVCGESCAAFVRAIATAIGERASAKACHEAALDEARRGGNKAVVDALEKAERESVARLDGSDSGWVLLALENAFHQLLHAETLEEGIVATIAGGGDTDTTAAIAGALLGAVHGRDAIPARWRDAVLTCRALEEAGAHHPRPPEFWPVDALELAERLVLAGSRLGAA